MSAKSQGARLMSGRHDVVFLFDVDNTLLDNDAVVADFRARLVRDSGPDAAEQYWSLFEELRRELGYADYLGALQRYRLGRLHDPRLLLVSSYLLDYPGQLPSSFVKQWLGTVPGAWRNGRR